MNSIDPIIGEVNHKLNVYDKDNKLNKHIISRFDEILTEKASKFSIEKIYLEMEKYINNTTFKNFKDKLQSINEEKEQKMKKFEESLSTMKEYTQGEVKKAMSRALGNLNTHIVHIAGGRPVNVQELESSLRTKADKEEFESLKDGKADKEDLNDAIKSVQSLESQLSDALVLFME